MKKRLLITAIALITLIMLVFVSFGCYKSYIGKKTSYETTEVKETQTTTIETTTSETTTAEITTVTTQTAQITTQVVTQPVTLDLISEATNNKVNNAAQAQSVLGFVNQYRADVGVAPLILSDELCLAASVRATEMLRYDYFDHIRPDGSSWSTIFSELGISYSSYGENIAWGYGDAAAVCAGWYESSGHYANMVKTSYGKIGVGVAYISSNRAFWVQLFTD